MSSLYHYHLFIKVIKLKSLLEKWMVTPDGVDFHTQYFVVLKSKAKYKSMREGYGGIPSKIVYAGDTEEKAQEKFHSLPTEPYSEKALIPFEDGTSIQTWRDRLAPYGISKTVADGSYSFAREKATSIPDRRFHQISTPYAGNRLVSKDRRIGSQGSLFKADSQPSFKTS